MKRGCDVSTFQAPGLVPWSNYDFGIVRSTYGVRRDKKTEQHAARIREAGIPLGLYHFFLPNQSIEDQIAKFLEVASLVKLGEGDILPCIDVEAYPDQFKGTVPTHWVDVCPAWEPKLLEFAKGLEEKFGQCVFYITQRDWHLLGKPEWVLKCPLWVAHYPKTGSTSPLAKPATPGNKAYAIWQYLVGPLGKTLQDPLTAGAVDQNIANELPLIGENLEQRIPEPPISMADVPFLGLSDQDWAEMEEARDRRCREV